MASVLAACCVAAALFGAQPTPTVTPKPSVQPPAGPTATVTATATRTATQLTTSTALPTATPLPSSTPLPTATRVATPTPISATAQPRGLTIGRSAEGRPITSYALGTGPLHVVIIGGIHGAPEANSAELVWNLLAYYAESPDQIPSNLTLFFLPEANPDGLADGTRELADGVDPNRNWPTADWSPSSYEPRGLLLGGGGPEPLSEPETIALAEWIGQVRPVTVLSYHSAGAIVMGGPNALYHGLVQAYASETRPYIYMDWAFYPVTGDFAQWCEEQGIPVVEVELMDHYNSDFERNLAGVQAVLDTIATRFN